MRVSGSGKVWGLPWRVGSAKSRGDEERNRRGEGERARGLQQVAGVGGSSVDDTDEEDNLLSLTHTHTDTHTQVDGLNHLHWSTLVAVTLTVLTEAGRQRLGQCGAGHRRRWRGGAEYSVPGTAAPPAADWLPGALWGGREVTH